MATLALDARTIAALADTPAVTAAFPFLRRFGRPAKRGCCGRTTPRLDFKKAVSTIMALSSARKSEFKKLLGVDRVTGSVVRAARVITVEF